MSKEVTWSRKNHSLFESFALDDHEIYKKTENVSLYVTTTDRVNRERVDFNKLHNCPGCGAAGTIGQLQDGASDRR